MKRLFQLALFIAALAVAPSAYATVGCGNGFDNSTCGNVGNPYANHPGWPLAHTTIDHTLGCQTITPAANTYYLLDGNLGTDETIASCLHFASTAHTGWQLDLGGFTVKGNVLIDSATSGADILNGTILASGLGTGMAPIKINNGPTATSGTQFQIEFLTLSQDYVCGTCAQTYVIYIQNLSNTVWTDIGYRTRFHNLTTTNGHTSVGNRSHNIFLSGHLSGSPQDQSFQVDTNYMTCPADADQCWTSSFFNVINWSFDHNQIVLTTHNAGLSYGEALDWEPGTIATVAATVNGLFEYNDITENNNRGVRIWGNGSISATCSVNTDTIGIDNNIFRTINLDAAVQSWGGVNLGESGATTSCTWTNVLVNANAFIITRGQGVRVSGIQGPKVYGNTFSCNGGVCTAGNNAVWANVAQTNESPASVDFYQNTVSDFTNSNIPTGIACGTAVYKCATGDGTSVGTVNYCQTGTVVAGTGGTANLNNSLGTCGGGGASGVVQLTPGFASFGNIAVGSTSSALPIVLTNVGSGTLTINSITASTNFSQTNNCGATLAPSAFCTIQDTFAPTAKGPLSEQLTVTTSASTSPDVVNKTGVGISTPYQGASKIRGSTVVK